MRQLKAKRPLLPLACVLVLLLNSSPAVAQFDAESSPQDDIKLDDAIQNVQPDRQLLPPEIGRLFQQRPDRETRLPRLQPHRILRAKESVFALAFTDDSSVLVTGGAGDKLAFWNTTDAKLIKTVDFPAGALCDFAITSNQQLVASTKEGGLYMVV